MSIAERLEQRGAAANARQMALNLLNYGVEPKIIAKSSGLSITELKDLLKSTKKSNEE